MRVVSYMSGNSFCGGAAHEADVREQESAILAFTQKRGWTIGDTYSDTDSSADAYRQMEEDGENRKFDCVVMDSVYDCGLGFSFAETVLKRILYPAGIQFAVASDDFYSGEKEAQEVDSYFENKKMELLSALSQKAIVEKGQAGFLTSKNVRYGYILSDDHKGLVVDADAARVVKGIFREFLNGKDYKQIADRLNAEGIDSPHEYLSRKLGRKTDPRTHGKWNLKVIGRIITNPIYMGKAERSIKGEITTLTVPAIVTEEEFQKAQELAAQNGGNRKKEKKGSANVLNGLIYEECSGEKMICMKSDVGSVYVTDRNYRYLRKNDRYIPEEDVMDAVKEALRKETELAKKIDAILRTADTDAVIETMTEPYRIEGRELLNRMNEIYEKRMVAPESPAEHWAELERCEQRFREIMAAVDKARLALSIKNPWLLLFRDAEVPATLTRKDVKKWVSAVAIEDYKRVTVTFQKQEWKELLPQEWLAKAENADKMGE